MQQAYSNKIRLGISTCLLGEKVRFDGGHKLNAFAVETLSQFFEWVPVCPEVEIGLGIPREALHLTGDPASPRMVTAKSGIDYTEKINRYAQKRVAQLKKLELDGYILKRGSPSCGMERVKVYAENGVPRKTGVGLFARVLLQQLPELPVEEEGRLQDARLRESFIVRVFSHHRWRHMVPLGYRLSQLMAFHAAHKFLLMAHSEQHLRELGKLVARGKTMPAAELRQAYARLFFEGLRRRATPRKHTNVLQHIAGYFKKQLAPDDKQELQHAIDDYHRELLPLIVPVTLLRHYVRKFDIEYIRDQVYLNPHPKELMILNHV